MDRRTKTLAIAFAVIVGYVILSQTVYPGWIKPLFTLDERIAASKATHDDLLKEQERVNCAKDEYRAFMKRSASTDLRKVEIELRSRLNELIEKHGLQGASVSGGRPSEDKKTGITRFFLEITAEAALPSTVRFLKDVVEIPQVVRFGNAKITRVSSSRNPRDADRVNFTLPLEILVPPAQRFVSETDLSKLSAADAHVRHQGRDYSRIWERKPFTEYEAAKPIVLNIKQKSLSPKQGSPATLQATVTGGNGELKYQWTPPEGLSDANILSPRVVDTSVPGSQVYTLTVTDARGQTAADSVTVTVAEPAVVHKEPPTPREPPPPPTPPQPQAWPDGKFMQIRMALITVDGARRSDELMVYNSKTRTRDYYKVGDAFDGGELVFVHQRGGVGRRNDEYFLYPVGNTLDAALVEQEGESVPELLDAARRHRASLSAGDRGADASPTMPPGMTAETQTAEFGPMPAVEPGLAPEDTRDTAVGTAPVDQKQPSNKTARPSGKKRPPRRGGTMAPKSGASQEQNPEKQPEAPPPE